MDTSHSAREAEARARADGRLHRQREILRPLGLLVIAAVAVGAINGAPAPAFHGRGLGVAAALVVFAAALAFAVRSAFVEQGVAVQAWVIAAMGAAGVALVALQPRGATELAGGAAVWTAIARLPLPLAVALAAGTTAGLGLAEALTGGSAAAVAAGLLLCALLGVVAYFIKQARASQETTELLLAELEDAREQQLAAAALAERSRIAGELHDVLAHALSGAALQLQGARKLPSETGRAWRSGPRSTGQASSFATGSSTPARPSAPSAASRSPASTSSSPSSRDSGRMPERR